MPNTNDLTIQTATDPDSISQGRRILLEFILILFNEGTMKILVVDDEFVSRERVAKILSNLGHQTHVAVNGVEALEALKAETFDLIFSDILMPVMDGFRLCQECKSDPDLNTIPFVFHTATYTDQKDEELALKFGGDKFLCKPAKRELIKETVEALMRDDHGPRAPSRDKDPETEKDLFKLYNERLIDKLEKKMLDLQREVSERRSIGQALEKAKGSLEAMIDERTADLVQANRQLKREVFERRQAEEELTKNEKKFRLLFEASRDAIVMTDKSGKFTDVNQATLDLFGYTRQGLMQTNFTKLYVDPSDGVKFQQAIDKKLFVKDYEVKLRHKVGGQMDCMLTVNAILDNDQGITGYQGVIRDVTKIKQIENALRKSEKKYRNLSIIDPLTTLHNLRQFHTQLSQEIKRANRYEHPLSLLLLDVDSFKKYNDTHGHLEGDRVLVKLGQVIHKCIRATDTAYRYGGEEFTVILPETQAKEAFVVAERIRTRLKATEFFPVAGKKSHLTISVGVSQYLLKEQPTSFIDRTDKAMYQAKSEGKDMVFIAST